MISILCSNDTDKEQVVRDYFLKNNLEDERVANFYKTREYYLKDVLRLDYSRADYRSEANMSQPNNTPSRIKIFEENDLLFNGTSINEIKVNTVTTKQDRNPNSGLIAYNNGVEGKAKWRYLTPRECFMLMGFDESDYEAVITDNPSYKKNYKLLNNEKLIKMAGNSICVDVLEAIFRQLLDLNQLLSTNVLSFDCKENELKREHA